MLKLYQDSLLSIMGELTDPWKWNDFLGMYLDVLSCSLNGSRNSEQFSLGRAVPPFGPSLPVLPPGSWGFLASTIFTSLFAVVQNSSLSANCIINNYPPGYLLGLSSAESGPLLSHEDDQYGAGGVCVGGRLADLTSLHILYPGAHFILLTPWDKAH